MTDSVQQDDMLQQDNIFDFVIVGAGSAGCVLAARLTEDPDCTVLLLEAGGPNDQGVASVPGESYEPGETEGENRYLYENLTVPQAALGGRRVALKTGRGLGGGSSVNALVWLQGHPADYDGWRDAGATGWGWADMLPYLRRSEHHEFGADAFHGAGGPMVITSARDIHPLATAFIAAGEELGLEVSGDLNGRQRDGVGLLQCNVRDGARHSAVDGYLRPALTRPNLVVRTGVPVERLIIGGARVVGVRYAGGEALARRSVVLSAGALRTPQLLMVSGIGPQAHLLEHGIGVVRDLPGVGANLHDHPTVVPMWPLTDAGRGLGLLYEDPARAYRLLRRGPLASLGQAMAVSSTTPELAAPDLHLALFRLGADAGQPPLPDPAVGCAVALLTPHSRGDVRLRSADTADTPIVNPAYLTAKEDRDRLRIGVQKALALFASPALRAVTGPALLPPDGADEAALDAFIEQTAGTYYHPVGTARMGTDADSVVGPDLAVHGVTGLHVVDASVIPTITRATIQAPIIAIAERGADLLRSAT